MATSAIDLDSVGDAEQYSAVERALQALVGELRKYMNGGSLLYQIVMEANELKLGLSNLSHQSAYMIIKEDETLSSTLCQAIESGNYRELLKHRMFLLFVGLSSALNGISWG
jgi:hypothetical protein